MNSQERLFLAIGGADPALVARCEHARRRRRFPYGLAIGAAACLALVLALGRVLPGEPVAPGPAPEPPGTQDPPAVITPDPEDGGWDLPPEQGGELGTLRLLSCAPMEQGAAADFLIYVNESAFSMTEEEGRCRIRSLTPLPEGFPPCGLEILHLPDAAPARALEEAEAALEDLGAQVSREELSPALPGSLYLRSSLGADWDSEQVELWFAGDGRGGTFLLASRYFLEAEEGLGARFRDMVSTFRAVDPDSPAPAWARSLYEAADRLSRALFADDLTAVSDLLAEGAQAEAYGENLWPEISVSSVDYTLDDGRNPTKATVSVRHRLNRLEGESDSFLTMELVYTGGSWQLTWSGLEK